MVVMKNMKCQAVLVHNSVQAKELLESWSFGRLRKCRKSREVKVLNKWVIIELFDVIQDSASSHRSHCRFHHSGTDHIGLGTDFILIKLTSRHFMNRILLSDWELFSTISRNETVAADYKWKLNEEKGCGYQSAVMGFLKGVKFLVCTCVNMIYNR